MPKKTKNDEIWWDEDVLPDAVQGSGSVSGDSTLNDLLLELISEVSKLNALLLELDADDFAVIRKRYRLFLKAVKQLPRTGSKPKVVGFDKERTEVPTSSQDIPSVESGQCGGTGSTTGDGPKNS